MKESKIGAEKIIRNNGSEFSWLNEKQVLKFRKQDVN